MDENYRKQINYWKANAWVAGMNDQLCSYDHQVVFVDRPYYTVKEVFFHLGHVIHPREDAYGRQLPADSTKHDRNEHLRVEYIEILTNRLIDEIDKQRVFVKSELELIIESPIEREQLNRARMYKTQIEFFLRALRIKAVFMAPAEMLVKKTVGDKEMLEFTRFDKYLILNGEEIHNKRLPEPRSPQSLSEVEKDIYIKPTTLDVLADYKELEKALQVEPNDEEINLIGHDEDIHKERLPEPRSPQSLSEVEQDTQIKQTVQEVLADYKELANAFKVVPNDEKNNLKWFLRRCSDVNDYPAFKDARVVAGRRGGSPARFRVLTIAAHLSDREKVTNRSLRISIEKHFGDILPEFDDLICPPRS